MTELQIFDALDAATEAALRASIEKHGVLVPVAVDQDDRIIDGHHRSRIAKELGVSFPTITHWADSDDHALALAHTLNADRRQLPTEQRREVVADLREQGHSERAIAGAVGVARATVRRDLGQVGLPGPTDEPEQVDRGIHLAGPEETSPIGDTEPAPTPMRAAPERVKGTDGKSYPATKPKPEADPAEEWFKAGDKAHRIAQSELFRIDAAVKPCTKVDWTLLADQMVRMTPLERKALAGNASVLETTAQMIRSRLETKLEVVK